MSENRKSEKNPVFIYVGNFFGNNTIYLSIFIYLAQNWWDLWINKNEILNYWKSQKIDSYKNVSHFAIEPCFKELTTQFKD